MKLLRLIMSYWIGFLLLASAISSFITSAFLFEFTNHEFIIASLIQLAGVLLALSAAYFFFEHRAIARQRRIDETLGTATTGLRGSLMRVVSTTVISWDESFWEENEPSGSGDIEERFREARECLRNRTLDFAHYEERRPAYSAIYWMLRRFVWSASHCRQTLGLLGEALTEHSSLILAMSTFVNAVDQENELWLRAMKQSGSDSTTLPEALYNLLVLSDMAIQIVDIIDIKGFPKVSQEIVSNVSDRRKVWSIMRVDEISWHSSHVR